MNLLLHKCFTFLENLSSFFYPPFCLHCEEFLKDRHKIFCPSCLLQMELINPLERCKYCFSEDVSEHAHSCSFCRKHPFPWHRAAAAFDYHGPAAALITVMKYSNQPYLAKSAAAFMTQQFFQLRWPLPDLIVPVPIPLTRWMQRGYNQSDLLAQHLGHFINRPVYKILKRKNGDYSQAGLNALQRRQLNAASFKLSNSSMLHDKIVLLVDDVMTTGSTLSCCAEVLLDGHPKNIYALTVCRAI